MSRRYGRNQRRAHRLHIAALQAEITSLKTAIGREQALVQGMHQKNAALKQQIEDAVQFLGEHHPALPPGPYRVDIYPGSHLRIMPNNLPLETLATTGATQHELTVFDLYTLAVETDYNPIDGRLHCIVQFANGDSRYAITPEAIRAMPRDCLIQRVSKQLAIHLVDQIKR
jgi:hypothetical protein